MHDKILLQVSISIQCKVPALLTSIQPDKRRCSHNSLSDICWEYITVTVELVICLQIDTFSSRCKWCQSQLFCNSNIYIYIYIYSNNFNKLSRKGLKLLKEKRRKGKKKQTKVDLFKHYFVQAVCHRTRSNQEKMRLIRGYCAQKACKFCCRFITNSLWTSQLSPGLFPSRKTNLIYQKL